MNLHAMEMPESPEQRRQWLERHLVSPGLGELVAELEVVQRPTAGAKPSLHGVLGPDREAVLRDGLAAASPGVIQRLLQTPSLLLELQEQVLLEGEMYWECILGQTARLQEDVGRSRMRLATALGGEVPNSGASVTSAPQVLPLWSVRGRTWPRVVPWIFSAAATAAAVVLGVLLIERSEQLGTDHTNRPPAVAAAAPAWGWAKPGALDEQLAAPAYLNGLADAAEQWFNKRPDDAVGLARRLAEFRQGCTALVLAEHKPLAAQDRDWLRERCRVWAGKIDEHLAAAEASKVAEAQANADTTVRQLAKALRAKAAELSKATG